MSVRVQRPAPGFTACAVVNGDFECTCSHLRFSFQSHNTGLTVLPQHSGLPRGLRRQVADPLLHPDGVDLRLVVFTPRGYVSSSS